MKRGSIGLMLLLFSLMMVLRGGSEIEHQAFVFSIGIDQEPNGMLRVSLQIPNAKREGELGSEAGGGGDTDGNEIIEASSISYVDACEVLNASIPREINFSQVLQIVISEELAKQGNFHDLLEDVLRSKNIRNSAKLIICRGNAQDFVKAQTAFLGIRLSVNIQTHMKLAMSMGIIPDAMIGEVVRISHGAWHDVVIPYAALSVQTDREESMGGDIEGRALDVQAGDMPETSENRIEYVGAALMLDGRMIGSLTGMEMQFLAFIKGNIKAFTFFVDDVYYRIRQMGPPAIRAIKSGESWILRVEGSILASVLRQGTADEERLRYAFTYEILNLLQKLQALGVDPIGFQGKAIRSVWTISDWPQAVWMQQYENATTEVTIQVAIGEVH